MAITITKQLTAARLVGDAVLMKLGSTGNVIRPTALDTNALPVARQSANGFRGRLVAGGVFRVAGIIHTYSIRHPRGKKTLKLLVCAVSSVVEGNVSSVDAVSRRSDLAAGVFVDSNLVESILEESGGQVCV